jgi:hypothetical protein
MNQSDFFKALGAPLANTRWSWGGIRADGSLVLRVWQDEVKGLKVCVLRPLVEEEIAHNPGYKERLEHLEMIEDGASSYMVMCRAVDTKVRPRTIKDFDQQDVFVGGALTRVDGEFWLELAGRIPARTLME